MTDLRKEGEREAPLRFGGRRDEGGGAGPERLDVTGLKLGLGLTARLVPAEAPAGMGEGWSVECGLVARTSGISGITSRVTGEGRRTALLGPGERDGELGGRGFDMDARGGEEITVVGIETSSLLAVSLPSA